MIAFRKLADMFVMPHAVPLNTSVCESIWHQYDRPAKARNGLRKFSTPRRKANVATLKIRRARAQQRGNT